MRFASATEICPLFTLADDVRTWRQALEEACAQMPDRGRYVDVLPFYDDIASCKFSTQTARGESVDWNYCAMTGLTRAVEGAEIP